MANGKVTTGFSKPYVAVYSATGTTVSYANGQILARGVGVSISPETSESEFYADNAIAESDAQFTRGTLALTVDGLLPAAEKLLFGLPTAGTDGWTAFGDDAAIPYVGVGYIARTISGGVVKYTPTVLPKCKFQFSEIAANTQGAEVEYQTQSLNATIFRCDNANRDWKWLGAEATDEATAEAALKTKLGIE